MPVEIIGVPYPSEFLDHEVRALLGQSQTNVTHDPYLGEQRAVAAYHLAMLPEIREKDPTAAGEALSKAELQATIGDRIVRAEQYYAGSVELLSGSDRRFKREIRATHLNHMRSLGIRLGRLIIANESENFVFDNDLYPRIWIAFEKGLYQIDRDDPYGVMIYHHMANIEAMVGNAHSAAHLASQGLWRLMKPQAELVGNKRQSEATLASTYEPAASDSLFFAKQFLALSSAGLLGEMARLPQA